MQRAKGQRAGASRRREEHVYRALADPTRRAILALLAEGERSAGAVAEAFPAISRPAVSKHLALLEEARLVRVREEGRVRVYALDPTPLGEVVAYIGALDAAWGRAMADLGAHLDAMD